MLVLFPLVGDRVDLVDVQPARFGHAPPQETPDFREAEIHHLGGGELEQVGPTSELVSPPSARSA